MVGQGANGLEEGEEAGEDGEVDGLAGDGREVLDGEAPVLVQRRAHVIADEGAEVQVADLRDSRPGRRGRRR